jgi:hypothetical protein
VNSSWFLLPTRQVANKVCDCLLPLQSSCLQQRPIKSRKRGLKQEPKQLPPKLSDNRGSILPQTAPNINLKKRRNTKKPTIIAPVARFDAKGINPELSSTQDMKE